jgi:hypothetical protein
MAGLELVLTLLAVTAALALLADRPRVPHPPGIAATAREETESKDRRLNPLDDLTSIL